MHIYSYKILSTCYFCYYNKLQNYSPSSCIFYLLIIAHYYSLWINPSFKILKHWQFDNLSHPVCEKSKWYEFMNV